MYITRPDRPWGPPSLLYNGYRVFPGGKVAVAWPWPPNSHLAPRIKKEYSYTSTPLWAFVNCSRVKFTCVYIPLLYLITCLLHVPPNTSSARYNAGAHRTLLWVLDLLFWDVTQCILVVTYRRLGSPETSIIWSLIMEPKGCAETPVGNYQTTLSKIGEEWRSLALFTDALSEGNGEVTREWR